MAIQKLGALQEYRLRTLFELLYVSVKVFYVLIAFDFLICNSGELASKATRWQRILIQEFALDLGEARYGRKLDLQCRCGRLEPNNSEFKSAETRPSQVDVQYRKNLRINQAMALYLNHHIGMPLEDFKSLALDVHGKCANTSLLLFHAVSRTS